MPRILTAAAPDTDCSAADAADSAIVTAVAGAGRVAARGNPNTPPTAGSGDTIRQRPPRGGPTHLRDSNRMTTPPSVARRCRAAGVTLVLALAGTTLTACRTSVPQWPAPARTLTRGDDTYRAYDLDDDGRLDYLQRLRAGYIDRLYFPSARGGPLRDRVVRPAANPQHTPLLVLLLDGVAFERIQALHARGRFRLFHPPTPVVSVFPTLTDPAFDLLFDTGPTDGYEAGSFDHAAGRVTDGVRVYLSGRFERWVRMSDYRLNFIEDAVMYVLPRGVYARELHRARKIIDRRLAAGARDVVIYLLSTDGLGHRLPAAELESELVRLDDFVERLVYDHRGRLEVAMLADHGMSAVPVGRPPLRRWDIVATLRAAGLRVTDRPTRPGDVAVPLFGLLDVARVHTRDADTRRQVVAVLRGRPECELVAERDGDVVRVHVGPDVAEIRSRPGPDGQPVYAYHPVAGDPLGVGSGPPEADDDGYAPAAAWLAATHAAAFPHAVPRLWDGFFVLTREHPDVVVSITDEWYVGSGTFSRVVTLWGTHGGMHRRVSGTFLMTTAGRADGPLDLPAVGRRLREVFGWEPRVRPGR